MPYPRYGHEPIRMIHLVDAPRELSRVGEYFFRRGDRGMALWVAVPNFAYRAETGFAMSRWPIDYQTERGFRWAWNGSEDRPTLTPSLGLEGIWHGFVTDGMLVEA